MTFLNNVLRQVDTGKVNKPLLFLLETYERSKNSTHAISTGIKEQKTVYKVN